MYSVIRYSVGTTHEPNNRVYINNLPWAATDDELKTHLSQAGQVNKVTIYRYADSGRSKGCGIAEYDSIEQASKAIKTLNDATFLGRRLQVREDREGEDGPPSGKGKEYQKNLKREAQGLPVPKKPATNAAKPANNNNTSSKAPVTKSSTNAPSDRTEEFSLFVGNLPWSYSWQDLKDLFTDYDPKFAAVKYGEGGRSRGYGIVRFDSNTQNADDIIEKFNGTMVGEPARAIVVRVDRD